MFPMKPVRVQESIFGILDKSKYQMERKFDGHRALLIVDGRPRLWTRGHQLIEMPFNIEEQLKSIDFPDGTVLDGEIWNPDARGSWVSNRRVKCQLTFWDVIKLRQNDVGQKPLEERQTILDNLIAGKCPDVMSIKRELPDVHLLKNIRAEAAQVHRNARSGFVHGVVLKRKASPRRDHSTRCVEHADWLKVVFWP